MNIGTKKIGIPFGLYVRETQPCRMHPRNKVVKHSYNVINIITIQYY